VVDSDNFGGRWTIEIRDCDDDAIGNAPAVLSMNREPQRNPHLPAGIPELRLGVRSLFESREFAPLFRQGAPFLGEAVVGFVDGRPWLNVSEWLLVEPKFPVGVRQIIGEPTCQRRIMLAARGIKSHSRRKSDDGAGGFIVGDLVHSLFQTIATAPDRRRLIEEAQRNPNKIAAEFLPREVALRAALLMIGDSPLITGSSEISTATTHIRNLASSSSVSQLLGEDHWYSEVQAANPAIDGIIDVRSDTTILELKTDSKQRTAHIEQAQLYLVGDMLKYGVGKVCQLHKAFVLRSSSQLPDDHLRVTPAHESREMLLHMLDRFVTARHRYLLTGRTLILPKISLTESECQDCPFFEDDPETGKPSACHFYCQTDRNWTCEGCKHLSSCSQSQTRHSYEVLDDANRIRMALLEEIQLLRREAAGEETYSDWQREFDITEIGPGGLLVLSPRFFDDVDPPAPGSHVFFQPHEWHQRIAAEVIENGFAEDKWIIAINDQRPGFETGMTCRIFQSRSRTAAAHSLLSCVDELQRRTEGSSKEGISFAGGRAISGKLEAVDSIQKAIEAGAQDIFCQCFSLHESRSLLRDYLGRNKTGSILIVSDAPELGVNDDDMLKLDARTIQRAITGVIDAHGALRNLKAKLDSHRIWMISSRRLFSDWLRSLPQNGAGYFDHLILFETTAISPLHYFTIRQLGQRRICIGDANIVGRKMASPFAIETGLGNNLLHRVLQKGFPIPRTGVMVKPPKQKLPSGISNALTRCKLEGVGEPEDRCTVRLECHDFPAQISPTAHYYEEHLVDARNQPSREIRVRPESAPSDIQLLEDLKGLELNLARMPQDRLMAPVSGNVYTVLSAPSPTVHASPGTWVVKMERNNSSGSAVTNDEEATRAAAQARQFLTAGTKPKNLVICSPFASQLQKIAGLLGEAGRGVTFRTPFNICGEQWGTLIISCAADSLVNYDPDLADPRLFYTMFRACTNQLHLLGHRNFVNNHPFLRYIKN
jgi:hypothetical protein